MSDPPGPLPPERLCYSIKELMQYTGFSRQLIYAEINDRKLMARRVRARTIVLADEANVWLKGAPPIKADDAPDEEDC